MSPPLDFDLTRAETAAHILLAASIDIRAAADDFVAQELTIRGFAQIAHETCYRIREALDHVQYLTREAKHADVLQAVEANE
jgi:hypothetical protein